MPMRVKVTVQPDGTSFRVDVVPRDLSVPVGVHGPIQWEIQNPASEGWKFQNHGIDITNPDGEFDHSSGGGARVFTWNNRHTKRGDYKYNVNVENGTAKAHVDPTIMND